MLFKKLPDANSGQILPLYETVYDIEYGTKFKRSYETTWKNFYLVVDALNAHVPRPQSPKKWLKYFQGNAFIFDNILGSIKGYNSK